jgi:hypothetical protein
MSITIALAHIIGAVIAMLAFGLGVLALGAWELKRNQIAASEEMSTALGIPLDQLDDPENANRIIQFVAERFSSERFQNRLSDLCWWIQAVWVLSGNLIQVGILIAVVWYSVTDDRSNAIYAWLVLAIAFLFWVISVAFALVCKLFTGRFPGQARHARKSLAEFVRNQ